MIFLGTLNEDFKVIRIQLIRQRLPKQNNSKPVAEEILAVRWMMEEFRVSVFAQNLKTAYPVSAKRILNHLKEISAN